MSKKTTPKAAPSARFDAFTVRDFEVNGEKNSDWSKIGAAWPHADGKGYRVVLQSLPVDGVIVLRTVEAKTADA